MNGSKNKFMELAIALSEKSVAEGGGPFGAVVVRRGEVVATGTNSVTLLNDPTAHAEVSAIRAACAAVKDFKLEECEIYSSCEPCPMCLSAIYWAGIRKIYFANTREDAKRWINLGFTTFQPSELAKFAIVLIFAHLISVNYERMKNPRYGVWPFLVLLGVVVMLMLLEPHLSGTILILGIGIVMMIVGGIKAWLVGLGLGGVSIVAVLYVKLVESGIIQYGASRIQMWHDPWIDAADKGYQMCQSLISIGSGGLLGVGLGKSRQKFLFLPEEHNDFIFAIIIEELGLVGGVIVVFLYICLLIRVGRIAKKCDRTFPAFLIIGIALLLVSQAVFNMMVAVGLAPVTGQPLPLISKGGTSTLINCAYIGMILSVSRYTAKLEEQSEHDALPTMQIETDNGDESTYSEAQSAAEPTAKMLNSDAEFE